jgi:hypothetical protein
MRERSADKYETRFASAIMTLRSAPAGIHVNFSKISEANI